MKVNGCEMSIENNNSITELLESLKVNENRVVVEVNGNIISKENYRKVKLNENDTIEVISFVGGG
ncbi:sulfur carrier protein ThiS [Clostridioides difficile]